MKIYTCNNCHKEFNKKSTYDYHLSRIIPCEKPENICIHCKKNYSNNSNLKKHLNICKKNVLNPDNKIAIDILKESIKQELQKDNEELKKKLEEQQKKIEELTHLTESNHPSGNIINNTTSNSNNNSNNNNTTTNNIFNIFSVGKEDLSRLSKEEIIKICTSGTYYPIVAAEIIHCNEKYPEFQNFLISNLRSNTGLVKINDNWVSQSHDEIFRAILKVDKNHVSSLMKDLEVDKKLQVKLEATQDEIDTNEVKDHQIPKIRNKLYSASKMINKNKKKEDKLLLNKLK
jgi:hypothetical protein